ncbi:MAG TPA: hypothetical protein VFX49_02780 [Chloroflexota bacterium]|nr:hypothetical protein [Chloroflexota bacterium]
MECAERLARLLRNAQAMLAQWGDYEADQRLPAAERRELPEPRIDAPSLRALVERLRLLRDGRPPRDRRRARGLRRTHTPLR